MQYINSETCLKTQKYLELFNFLHLLLKPKHLFPLSIL